MKTPYIIAEIANTHDGNVDKVLKLLDEISTTGANGVKFQIVIANELLAPHSSQMKQFKTFEFSDENWNKIFEYAKKLNLQVWTDVFGLEGMALADRHPSIHGYKVHTSDILNTPLLLEVSRRAKPVLLSTSGSTDLEVKKAIDLLMSVKQPQVTLMHGYQVYPTPLEETRLNELKRLKNTFKLPVGIQDHNDGDIDAAKFVPILACLFDVTIIEKHITMNRADKETDYYSSLNPSEFKAMVENIKNLPALLGPEVVATKPFSKVEAKYSRVAKKKLVSTEPLSSGTTLSDKTLTFKRTDDHIESVEIEFAVGKKLKKDIPAYQALRYSDFDMKIQYVETGTSRISVSAADQKINGSDSDIFIFLYETTSQNSPEIQSLLANFLEKNLEYGAAMKDSKVIGEAFTNTVFKRLKAFNSNWNTYGELTEFFNHRGLVKTPEQE